MIHELRMMLLNLAPKLCRYADAGMDGRERERSRIYSMLTNHVGGSIPAEGKRNQLDSTNRRAS
jgi:hypothetical protein